MCPKVDIDDIHRLASCIHADLVSYWQRRTGHRIDRPVVIEPTYPPAPRSCYVPQQYYAWYCSDNSTIYINTSMLTLWREHFSLEQVPYSLAVTLAHEVGHAAQFALKPSLADADTTDPAISRRLELQADCLAGVWIGDRVAAGRLAQRTLLTVWRKETELLNTPDHQKTHGGPDARLTKTRQGITEGLTACGLDN